MEEARDKQVWIVGNRFEIKEKLGSGSFGDVFTAYDRVAKQDVGMKIDINVDEHSQIPREAKLMQVFQGGEGFPTVFWSGVDDQNKQALAMDLLGHNLETLFVKCGRKFTLKTVLMIADQMLKRIESVHSKGFVYRDVKPENFIMGKKGKQQSTVFLIDFGLIKRYKDPKTNKHIQYRDNKSLIGTARYVSINTHLGIEQSRRDDLESLAYMLIYFAKGKLPWQGLLGETKEEKHERLKQKKIQTSLEILCEGLPKQFLTFITYCRGMKYEEQPNYFYLKQLLKELFFELEFSWDNVYDWMELNEATLIVFLLH